MGLIHEIDYGTPAAKSERQVTLTIDGRSVTVPEGTSIMRAAMELGTEIPKLCATDMLDSFGSCRVCVVEIEGRGGTPASCTTPVAEGISVRTQSDRLGAIRRGVMELYVSDHPLGWDANSGLGGSEFDSVLKSVGLTENRYGTDGRNHVAPGNGSLNIDYIARDTSNPYFTYDPAQCIVCSRCVRACEEVQGTFALTVEGRGFESRIAAGPTDFLESECVSCGACVQACPTDALREKSVLAMGMPTSSVVTTCAYCGVGCSFKAEMQGEELVRMVPWKDGKANRGHSCVKGRFAYGYSNHKDRILNPMVREKITDPWREVTWDEAFGHIAKEFRRIQYQYGKGAGLDNWLMTPGAGAEGGVEGEERRFRCLVGEAAGFAGECFRETVALFPEYCRRIALGFETDAALWQMKTDAAVMSVRDRLKTAEARLRQSDPVRALLRPGRPPRRSAPRNKTGSWRSPSWR